MRKLRRLPWRIPKSHNHQPSAAPAEACPRAERVECAERVERVERPEPEPRTWRDEINNQPVAFAGGRYVYGDAPSVTCTTEIRRKARHRVVLVGA
jgi:hypothetical protein